MKLKSFEFKLITFVNNTSFCPVDGFNHFLNLLDQTRATRAEMTCPFNTNFEIKINKHHLAVYIVTAVAAMTALPTNQIADKTLNEIATNFNKRDCIG